MSFQISSELKSHEGVVRNLIHIPYSGQIVSASRDCTVKIWKPSSGLQWDLVTTLKHHQQLRDKAGVASIHFIPSNPPTVANNRLVTCGYDHSAFVINLDSPTYEVLHELKGHSNAVVCATHTPHGDIVTGSIDKSIIVWRDGKEFKKLEGHDSIVWGLCCLSNGTIVSGSSDKTLKLWKDNECIKTISVGIYVRGLAAIDGEGFACSGSSGSLRFYSLEGDFISELSHHTDTVYHICSYKGKLTSSSEDGSVVVLSKMDKLDQILVPGTAWSSCILSNGDVAVACNDAIVRVFSQSTERQAKEDQKQEYQLLVNRSREPPVEATFKKSVKGVFYDNVIDVDIDDGKPMIALGYNNGEKPEDVADRFIKEEGVSPNYRQQIIDFVRQVMGLPALIKEETNKKQDEIGGSTDEDEGGSLDSESSDPDIDTSDPTSTSIVKRLLELQLQAGETLQKKLISMDEDGLVDYIKSGKCRNIIVMSGAGISVAAGIPDFRTPGTGLYSNLQKYDLPVPEAIFELGYFKQNPKPFFTLAKEMYPGLFHGTDCHWFIRLLHAKGLLLKNYTQNIDTLELSVSLPDDKVIYAHGSFSSASCIECGHVHSREWVKEEIFADRIPHCQSCKNGLVKPDIVFFGESLPARFFTESKDDFPKADLLLVMGTSLKVHPFAGLISKVHPNCPRALINREPAGSMTPFGLACGHIGFDFGGNHNYRDVPILGDCQESVVRIITKLGWKEDFDKLKSEYEATKGSKKE